MRLRTVRRFLALGIFVTGIILLPACVHATESPIDARRVVAHTNVERYRADVPLLSSNDMLTAVAYRKMADMFTRQYFAHNAPTGEDVAFLADGAEYAYLAIGENLALGTFTSSKEMVRAWMESPGHRANILSSKYSEIGVAVGQGRYEGRRMWIGVQVFGLPRASCPEPDETVKSELDGLITTIDFLRKLLEMRERGIGEPNIRRSEYAERVASYNKVVALYNERVGIQRALVSEYNESVRLFNECIASKIK
jgi:hypothetical protein